MLLVVGGLVGVSIVFALGVERGKQLARAERPLLGAQTILANGAQAPQAPADVKAKAVAPTDRTPDASPPKTTPELKAAPKAGSSPKAPTKIVGGKSRYAVQVVSYRRPKLARLELQRLQQRGERAFLLMKQDTVALLVGPFPSKENAQAKLASLRQRYEGCFLRSL
jgi:cell division septation protein DedD